MSTALMAVSLMAAMPLAAADNPPAESKAEVKAKPNQWEEKRHESHGAVTVGGKHIEYTAYAGTLMIEDKKGQPGAMMSYVAYIKKSDGSATNRPITFIYNGGPGSSTMWLHMGAFGPKRVLAGDAERGPSAPYRTVENEYSPLDASDLVFIDMPGTGFGRVGQDEKLADPDKLEQVLKKNEEVKKDFWGIDQDARAFTIFITKFLNKYDRWTSPRFLFGESYGTMRSAVLVNSLQRSNIDMNGVMLLSQILNYGSSVDGGRLELGDDLPFIGSLPSYAATAWYHNKLPNKPKDLEAFLADVRRFDLQEYAPALAMGDSLPQEQKHAMAEKLHQLIGLPADYIERADLRVNGGMFRKTLRADEGLLVGRLDTRYTSPPVDPMAKEADYDPQSAAISSAYVAVFNDYARGTLGFGKDDELHVSANVYQIWDTKHQPPGANQPLQRTANVIPDLAASMRTNPKLKVMLCSGYFDLSTMFFASEIELNHLNLPPEIRKNIEIKHFMTGHMVYVHEDALKQLHGYFAQFVADATTR
jgi:carboxypeptidase C (cathepsin A)